MSTKWYVGFFTVADGNGGYICNIFLLTEGELVGVYNLVHNGGLEKEQAESIHDQFLQHAGTDYSLAHLSEFSA